MRKTTSQGRKRVLRLCLKETIDGDSLICIIEFQTFGAARLKALRSMALTGLHVGLLGGDKDV